MKIIEDGELERHIRDCGKLMMQSFARYEQSNCFSDIGDAHRWHRAMEDAIKLRSPAQVSRMEAEMGLANA